jgi:glycosyltransferase involved in cell wall biosynthesis
MRVLWFSNGPVSAKSLKNIKFVGESWIGALENLIKKEKDIELGVAFQYQKAQEIESHTIDGVSYYICPITSGIVKRKIGFGGKYYTNDALSLKYYLSIIDEFKPDLIQIFGTENNYGLIVPHVKVPVVFHIQGILALCIRKYFSGISQWEVMKYTSLIQWMKGGTMMHYFNFQKRISEREMKVYASAHYFFGRTHWDQMAVKVLSNNAKYFHCEEIIRDDFYQNKWNKSFQQPLKIVSILRNNLFKGFDLVQQTANLLEKKGIAYTWNIIGSSASDGTIRLFSKKFKGAFNKNIVFLGGKDGKEIIELMCDSHILVQTSYLENSPNSVCEAMILGMPVISTAVGGVSSIIENQKEGILVQENDPVHLAGSIMDLYENPEKAKSFGEKAMKRARERHNPETILQSVLSYYQIIRSDYGKQ